MTLLHHDIRIAAPPEKVWAVLADLEAVQHYNAGIKHAKYITVAREGIGASRHCDLKPKGWVKERVIAWEPQNAMTMELYESQWPLKFMRWRTTLSPDGAGTRVSQQMEYQIKFGLLGTLLDKLVMRRKLDQTLTEVFASLKRFVETGATPR
ncbi:MAG: SRPBCC family protein [Betaproteobacteria bacterium]|nr:SRPBCC family protein [Betaproteobacteria bacterium]